MERELQNKSIRIEEKSENQDGSLHIKFYACAFNNIDSWGDIIVPTACDTFLASEDSERMKLCYQHDQHEVIGTITSKEVDTTGLLCEADILPTTTGKDVITLIKGGAINEFSIGYYADNYHYEKVDQAEVRFLDAITIVEVSPVTRAANPKAVLIDAKSQDFTREIQSMTDEDLEKLKAAVDDERTKRLIADL